MPIEMSCNKGILSPQTIHCETGQRKSREELASESHGNGKSNNVIAMRVDNSESEDATNATEENVTEELKMCGPPSISDGALVYK